MDEIAAGDFQVNRSVVKQKSPAPRLVAFCCIRNEESLLQRDEYYAFTSLWYAGDSVMFAGTSSGMEK